MNPFSARVLKNHILDSDSNLPYALCNIRGSGKFVFVTRGYFVFGFYPLMKRIHVSKFPRSYGFHLSDSQIEQIKKVVPLINCNFYFYQDHTNPFTCLPIEQDQLINEYVHKLNTVESIIFP